MNDKYKLLRNEIENLKINDKDNFKEDDKLDGFNENEKLDNIKKEIPKSNKHDESIKSIN